jgi:hypothetical protein
MTTIAPSLRRPGRHRLVWALADHDARGMRATLRVSGRTVVARTDD